MRPEHRAPRPAWGENPQRPARYDAAGRKPRAVRASGGRSRSPGRKIPIYTPRAAVLVMTLGHYRWSLLGISARHPRTRGNPIPGRWINGGSRRARGPRGTVRRPARRVWSGRSRTRLPRVLPGFERARAASVSRLRVQSALPVPNPNLPISFPDNFPVEVFYFRAISTITAGSVRALLNDQLEGSFANGNVAIPGDQIVFSRVRVRIFGASPGGTYTVTPRTAWRCCRRTAPAPCSSPPALDQTL